MKNPIILIALNVLTAYTDIFMARNTKPLAILLIGLIPFVAVNAANQDLIHVRLKDRLDRPDDGYCFDILGTGETLRVDLPLFVHNCKPFATPDSAIIFTTKHQLVFPAADVCVTAFGVNNTVLPGTSVLLRPCDERSAFYQAADLQKFDHEANGQLKLHGFDLCLAVGDESSSTYSPHDRWRVLSLETCSSAIPSHSVWEMVPL
ncbi:hypothetical protein [Methyloprofundus sp.]|uniref:hypothetical protein n=1 Tax=Methyloprofundus sp. TaxID=2020875 RepID=UPI003D0B4D56